MWISRLSPIIAHTTFEKVALKNISLELQNPVSFCSDCSQSTASIYWKLNQNVTWSNIQLINQFKKI